MATKKPRIMVTLDQDKYDALSRFAAAMGQSRSALVADVLDEMFPVFDRLAAAVEMARGLEQGAKEGWKASLLERLDPAEVKAERARDDALQAMHQVFLTLEGAVKDVAGSGARSAGGNPRAGGSGGPGAAA